MTDFDPNAKYVSGPVNVVRLEGYIRGIKKVIYLFMDFHMDVSMQGQCPNIFSKDIQNYFVESFYNLNKTTQQYDFFLEIYLSHLTDPPPDPILPKQTYKDMYLQEVRKLFKKLFIYDPEVDKVSVSDILKNIRLHYIDIRDYFFDHFYHRAFEVLMILGRFAYGNYIDINELRKVTDSMNFMKDKLEIIVNALSQPYDKKDKLKIIKTSAEIDKHEEILRYFLNKIMTSYKYDDIKDILKKHIDKTRTNFTTSIKEFQSTIQIFNDYGNSMQHAINRLTKYPNGMYIYGLSPTTKREMIKNMNDIWYEINDRMEDSFVNLVDIYFLRRFLDKDYITNGIGYTGAAHSLNYIDILVNDFDFRITHASYSKISDMEKLTLEVRNKDVKDLGELFFPPVFQQCSDMSEFPENFL